MKKLDPEEAFAFYSSLGPGRSYAAVAERFSVSKRAIVQLAKKQGWQDRLAEIEEKARHATNAKAAESIEQMNDRHLKTLRLVQARALEALKAMPIATSSGAVQALVATMREERTLRTPANESDPARDAQTMAARICEFVRLAEATVAVEEPDEDDWDDEPVS